MSKLPFVGDIISFVGEERIVVNGVGSPKVVELPRDVVKWLRSSYEGRRMLEEFITHYKFRRRLCNGGALRSLILLLYARLNNIPPYKVARIYGVSPEQLYRIERGLRKDGLLDLLLVITSPTL